MAKKAAEPQPPIAPMPEAAQSEGPLTVDALFKFIEARGAKRVQLIRTTGTGRLDATINPQDIGNILIVIEIDPKRGVVV